ncbi:carbamoyl-phosphate synthase pyrimidine-specific large chain [Gracilaria domingensis]|nr:carbamoyl-phosphate synthase pyrimidine-specific large chain [Gracilaria domingensis]
MAILEKVGIKQAENSIAHSYEEAADIASRFEYPVVFRPSYVLGGCGMEQVYDDKELEKYMSADVVVESEHPVLIDHFLDSAIEVDVDGIADMHRNVVMGGVLWSTLKPLVYILEIPLARLQLYQFLIILWSGYVPGLLLLRSVLG